LLKYRELGEEGGWEPLPDGPTLHEGDRDARVAALRARLTVSGDLDGNGGADRELFDPSLERGVRRFQGRHGLAVDGVVGKATLAALNVPVRERVRQIERNMERWRWLPEELGGRYILVNTADFSLEVVEEGEQVMAMRVVTGKKARRTPVFSGRMTYLVLNPYWHIPHKLAVEDILPKIKKDPGYLDRQKIRVFESWEEPAPEIQPETVDWSEITESNLVFKLRQDAGPRNALGRVKFMFPNKFAVYLHDTPSRTMFQRSQRDFSSGCIRIEEPIDLALYVLRGDPDWTSEEVLSAIESRKNRIVWLPEPIPVHVLYWTAWVEGEGTVHFRNDVYDRDGPLDAALREGPRHYQ
jgi:murein L,D-transpeptidase YcbB/YkuD